MKGPPGCNKLHCCDARMLLTAPESTRTRPSLSHSINIFPYDSLALGSLELCSNGTRARPSISQAVWRAGRRRAGDESCVPGRLPHTPPAGVMASASGNVTCKVEPRKGNHDILPGPNSNIARPSHCPSSNKSSCRKLPGTGLIMYGRIVGGAHFCRTRSTMSCPQWRRQPRRGESQDRLDACAIYDSNLYRQDNILSIWKRDSRETWHLCYLELQQGSGISMTVRWVRWLHQQKKRQVGSGRILYRKRPAAMWLLRPVSPPLPADSSKPCPARVLWRVCLPGHQLMGIFVPVGYRGQIMCMPATGQCDTLWTTSAAPYAPCLLPTDSTAIMSFVTKRQSSRKRP